MLNGTFLVQAIHFFIAYVIIERLLLRPVISEMKADELEKKNLQARLQAQGHAVKNLEEQQRVAWQSAHEQFKNTIPGIPTIFGGKFLQEFPKVPPLDSQQKASIVDTYVASLVKEVKRVH